jgi:L-ascorbate metabolism protein UlaG (beta-lactamase superfamily)
MKTTLKTMALLFFLLALMTGCAKATPMPTEIPTALPTETPTPIPESVTLQYIGHACFLLTASDGTRIVMDPYNSYVAPSEIAKFPDNLTADFVTISHFHSDHSNINGVSGKKGAFYQPGPNQGGGVKITGYKGDHGFVNGATQGDNTVFVFEIGAIKIVHMGAEGVITEPDILAAIENADVVMIDADGSAQHPITEMMVQLQQSHVRTVIPTHYSFSETTRFYGAITIDEFIELLPPDVAVVKQDGSEIKVTPNMPEQVLILTPLALSTQK